MVKNPVLTKHGTEVVEKEIWLVQYNLMGLHKPRKLTWKVYAECYSSKCGNYYYEPNKDELDSFDIVRRVFLTKELAEEFYTELDTYREFIKRHL